MMGLGMLSRLSNGNRESNATQNRMRQHMRQQHTRTQTQTWKNPKWTMGNKRISNFHEENNNITPTPSPHSVLHLWFVVFVDVVQSQRSIYATKLRECGTRDWVRESVRQSERERNENFMSEFRRWFVPCDRVSLCLCVWMRECLCAFQIWTKFVSSECANNCVYKIQCNLLNLLNRMETEPTDGKQNDFHLFQFISFGIFYHFFCFVNSEIKKVVTQLCENENEQLFFLLLKPESPAHLQLPSAQKYFGIVKQISFSNEICRKSTRTNSIF